VARADGATTQLARRRYDSPVRRQQAADTRERITAAGADLVHTFTSWDWDGLTFRAIAERAGVSESTVYRHFANERELHGAVMQRLHEQAGVNYDDLHLDNVAEIAGQVISTMTTYAAAPITVEPDDPVIASIDAVRRDALVEAVARAAPKWSAADQHAAASVLDVLWSPLATERLIAHWNSGPDAAIQTMQWAIDLVVEAIESGRPPASR
jgi:AcrR family transcriptional regulator